MKSRGPWKEAFTVRRSRREAVSVASGETAPSFRIAVIADTHSAPHPRAAELVAREAPQLVLHAGDIGDLSVLERFQAIAPTRVVRGNIDVTANDLPDALTLDLVDGDARLLTLLLLHIAVNGPRIRVDAARRATEEHAQLVVCGHSHVPFIGRDRGLTVFNPGSIGPRRLQLPIVFGVLELAAGRLSMKHVDCETGETWLP